LNLNPFTAVIWAALAAGVAPVQGADERAVPFVFGLEDQANEIWSGLPADPDDARVRRLGGTSRACAADALRQVSSVLAQEPGGRAALRSLSLTLPLPRSAANELSRGNRSADLIAAHVGAATRSDHVLQPLVDAACGDGGAFYDLRALPEAPGRLYLHMLVEGGCACRQSAASGSGLRRFHIVGEAELEPGIVEKKNVLRLRAKEPRYSVLASCGTCEEKTEARQVDAPRVDPCGQPCAPLAHGIAAWQREATDATAKLADLAGKATTIELNVSTQRQELDAAQGTQRKSRPLLERISALQDRIKAAQAELTRITRASQEIQQHLAVLQRVAGDTRVADERCQSQCKARQQRKGRSPDKSASSDAPAATAAGGGGLGTGTIIVGGAALAAGGVAVVALNKGDGDGPVDFTGTWSGTRTTTATVNQPLRCTRVFNEIWMISQTGRDLRADITATAQGCGPSPACGACQIFAFPRNHPGTVDGSTARFFVFPELQVPSCVLPLRLQGDTLSGTMPACDTGANDTLSDEVTLRRMGR